MPTKVHKMSARKEKAGREGLARLHDTLNFAGNVVVLAAVGTAEGDETDKHHQHDNRADQPVFNGSCAALIVPEPLHGTRW